MLNDLSAARLIAFPSRPTEVAVLSVYECPKDVPFPIARVFVINAMAATDRGAHAHYECQQLLVCLQGRVRVTLDDGRQRSTVVLENPEQGLLVPAGIWAEQHYEEKSILMVLASHGYDEADYIRDYSVYREFRAKD